MRLPLWRSMAAQAALTYVHTVSTATKFATGRYMYLCLRRHGAAVEDSSHIWISHGSLIVDAFELRPESETVRAAAGFGAGCRLTFEARVLAPTTPRRTQHASRYAHLVVHLA